MRSRAPRAAFWALLAYSLLAATHASSLKAAVRAHRTKSKPDIASDSLQAEDGNLKEEHRQSTDVAESASISLQAGAHTLKDPACGPESERFLKVIGEGFVVFSALRDPIDKEVRVFLDAEKWVIGSWVNCIFANDNEDWRQPDNHAAVSAKVEYAWGPSRRYDSYVMTCPDAGANYTRLIFTTESHAYNCPLKSVPIHTIPLGGQNTIGACLSVLYTKLPILEEWLQHNIKLGVDHFSVYYTSDYDRMAIERFYGIYVPPKDTRPFQPVHNPKVSYYHYHAPIHTYYFGQTAIVNECIFRNRRRHKYLIVADADEFLHDMHPRGMDLVSRVDSMLPNNSASLAMETVMFHRYCPQNNGSASERQSLPDENVAFARKWLDWQPGKSIVAPTRVRLHSNHYVASAAEGYIERVTVKIKDMFFKHIRQETPSPDDCADLIDIRDASAFEAAMAEYDQETRVHI